MDRKKYLIRRLVTHMERLLDRSGEVLAHLKNSVDMLIPMRGACIENLTAKDVANIFFNAHTILHEYVKSPDNDNVSDSSFVRRSLQSLTSLQLHGNRQSRAFGI